MIINITNRFLLLGYKISRSAVISYKLFLRLLRQVDHRMGQYSPFSKIIDPLPLPRGIGYFLPDNIALNTLFEILDTRGVRYVVLRWFDKLPEIETQGDVDILIHNDDVGLIKGLFTARITSISFDIYTVSACYGFTYKNLPYYPPYLATAIIESRVLNDKGIYVPSPKHHFFSLAYHALYHKGDKAILSVGSNLEDESKYVTKLKELAPHVKYDQDFCFHRLDSFLALNGWRPPFDTFRRIAAGNPDLKKYLPEVKENITPDLMAFVVRDSAVERNQVDLIIEKIKQASLEIFYICNVDEQQKRHVEESIRGGEWGKEDFPYKHLGGGPIAVIIVIDRAPEFISEAEQAQYPFVRNRHTLLKHDIRNQLNVKRLCGEWANMIHCSDDIYEALDYIKAACPYFVDELFEEFPHFKPFWEKIKDRTSVDVRNIEPVLTASYEIQ